MNKILYARMLIQERCYGEAADILAEVAEGGDYYDTPGVNMAKKKVMHPSDLAPLMSWMSRRRQEYFVTIYLNGAHEVMDVQITSKGLVNRTIVHPREVFAPALVMRCTSIIVLHNHPSGGLEPSSEDIEITERLRKAGEIVGITVLDHVVVGKKATGSDCPSYLSFVNSGRLR